MTSRFLTTKEEPREVPLMSSLRLLPKPDLHKNMLLCNLAYFSSKARRITAAASALVAKASGLNA